MKLYFFGATRSVTGSNYLIELNKFNSKEKIKILIDCGMFQGARHVEEKNYEDFPYNPREIDYVLLTHAHLDHIGRIPKLYKDGFRGKIFTTFPTKDFARIMLEDSQEILEEEARQLKKEPLYQKEDVEGSLNLIHGADYSKKINLGEQVIFRFRDAGHILGSAIIELWLKEKSQEGIIKERKIIFSGDLGNPPVPLLRPTEKIEEADYVVVESTYGNKIHEDKEERKDLLENAIEDTITRGGTLMIPAFALERTQELLFELNELVENNRVPKAPVFIDSPLAIKAIDIYKRYFQYYNKKAVYLIKSGDDLFKFPGLVFTKTVEESKKINNVNPPKIIIAGSGMSTGGRILHHEIRYLPDPNSTILFIGFQVARSLGRRIQDGVKEVRIFNQNIAVRAEARTISGYSAHADREMLRNWLEAIKTPPQHIFVVHGEEEPALALVQLIRDHLGIKATAPIFGDVVEL